MKNFSVNKRIWPLILLLFLFTFIFWGHLIHYFFFPADTECCDYNMVSIHQDNALNIKDIKLNGVSLSADQVSQDECYSLEGKELLKLVETIWLSLPTSVRPAADYSQATVKNDIVPMDETTKNYIKFKRDNGTEYTSTTRGGYLDKNKILYLLASDDNITGISYYFGNKPAVTANGTESQLFLIFAGSKKANLPSPDPTYNYISWVPGTPIYSNSCPKDICPNQCPW